MGQKRDNLERQLSQASSVLAKCEQELEQKGLVADARAKNPKWRNLNARCRQLRNRLNSVGKIEAVNQELKQRKTAAAS